MRRWFIGDTHMHTTNSDGSLQQYKLIEKCKKTGLDWAIITDHNYDTVCNGSYSSDGLTVIQGQEITVEAGHVNIWGVKVPAEPPYDITDENSYIDIINKCKDKGATVCANHPFCTNCGFRIDVNTLPVHCVEVWNTIQHSDNVTNMKWWVSKLLNGERLAAVGGSDFHRDYAGVNFLAMPATVVYSKSNSAEDILSALKEGRSFVTNTPNTSMLYLSAEGASIGDSIELTDGLTGECKATKLLPGFTLKIFNNDKLIYSHKALFYEKEHNAVFGIKEKGFIRAEIDFKLSKPIKKAFEIAEKEFLTSRGKTPPKTEEELFWAFTNPIWIE